MRVLVVAAHPDDEILGIGGTIRRHILDGDEAFAVILGEGATSRYHKRENAGADSLLKLRESADKAANIIGYKQVFFENLPDNRFDGLELLEIVKTVEKHIAQIKPEVVYTHHYGDINIDHRVTFNAVITAARPIGNEYPSEIYAFETVSSTEWNYGNAEMLFRPNVFVDITGTMEDKLKALKCYESELKHYPHPRSVEGVTVTAKKWGTVISREYAEPLEAIRIVK